MKKKNAFILACLASLSQLIYPQVDKFNAYVVQIPKENITIAVCSNGIIYPVNDILINALGLYFGKEFKIPEFKQSVKITSSDLDKYLGKYSGPEFPLKVTVTKKKTTLIIQAEGQPEFPVVSFGNHQFEFEQAKIKLTFNPEKKTMVVEQGGKYYLLSKM